MTKTPKKQNRQPGIEAKMDPTPEYIKPHYQGSGKLKVALITGGDSGIAPAVSVHFAPEGANVALEFTKAGDSIINTTSVTAYRSSPNLIDYSSTKGAITSFTRSLATNIVKKQIRVNAVAPGPVWTPLIVLTFDAEKIREFGSATAMKRASQTSELGPSYVFVASEDASFITGQVIHVNGGEVVNG